MSTTKTEEDVQTVSIDALKEEVDKLQKLLSDPQPGLFTWHGFVRERLKKLHALTAQALGITSLADWLRDLDPNILGETLRQKTFVGKGVGCYENFDVRPDAVKWTPEQKKKFITDIFGYPVGDDFLENYGEGFTFQELGLSIHVFWYWEGDGTLYFSIKEGDQEIRSVKNRDCKKDHDWDDWNKVTIR